MGVKLVTILDVGIRREWSASRPDRFTHGERAHGTYWIRGRMDHRAGLDAVENRKISYWESKTALPALSPSLYDMIYWHCGHSWPIVPASGDSKDDCEE
jgi:hypothetical protein